MSSRRAGPATCLVLFVAACTIAPAPEGAPGATGPGELPPPGYGTLRQSEVSLALTSRDLQILLTPLDESVTRVTAPDTYERLHAMSEAHRSAGPADGSRFLVSFYTDEFEAQFTPEDVQLLSRGIRVLPAAIEPITPGWGQHRVRQRQTEMAVYAFPAGIDLESDLVLTYGFDQTNQWSVILPRIQAERARARARAGIGG